MDHHQQSRSAQRSRASLIILIVLAFLLMVAAIVLVVTLPDDAALQLPTETTDSLVVADTGFACSDSEALRMYPFKDGVIKLDNNRISYLDIHGVEQFGIEVEMSAPMACWNDSLFLTVDRGGYSYVLLNQAGQVFAGVAAGRISSASLSISGHLAIVQDQNEGTGVVTLYAPETGDKLFDCYNPESGYPLSVAFPDSGNAFDVTLVNTGGSEARPVIKRYAFDGSQLGQRIPDLTGLMPLLIYDRQGQPVICGATSLAALTYESSQTVWQASFQQILSVKASDQGILVLGRERLNGPCNLYVLKDDGTIQSKWLVSDDANHFEISGDLVIMGCGTRLLAFDLKTTAAILDTDLATEIIRVGFAGRRSVTVVSRGGVRRLNIPE
jgi:hypothetical protein